MATRLEGLFRMYAADLKRFSSALDGQFACPLCLRLIAPGASLADQVAEEHVVPETLGGRLTTLTCRQCNNSAGAELEAHLVQRVLIDARKRPVEAIVDIGGAVHRAEVHFPGSAADGFRIFGIPKQSDLRQVAEAQRLLSEGANEIRLRLNFGYVVLRTAAALVRSAYLLMFRNFGYRYVLDPSAAVIRDHLADPLKETDVLKGVSWRLEASAPSDTAVAIVTAPRESQSFAVFLKLDTDPDHIAAVALPPPGSDGAQFFRKLAEAGNQRTCSFSLLPTPSGFMPFLGVWNHVINQKAI